MELAQQKKLVSHIFRLLKVTEIIIPIGRTNKGNLGIKFTKDREDYEMFLDAVPLAVKHMLDDDNNIELKKILDKYLFETTIINVRDMSRPSLAVEPKKKGRPFGSKNKVHDRTKAKN